MSRNRLIAKVRTNGDFKAITRHLDESGLAYVVVKPNHKGHPALRITLPDGREVDHYITCTPRGRSNSAARVASLRRFLASQAEPSGAK